MKNKKVKLIIIAIFLIALAITGVTYAFWSWTSNINKNIVFNIANNLKDYIEYNEGASQFTGELNESNSYLTGSTHSTISIYKKSGAANIDLVATIHMDINAIGNNMKNSPALKWVVTEGTDTDVGDVLAKGNFVGTNSGDTLTLVPDIAVNTTETFYTIWIWLDSNENPSSSLSGETLNTSVWTEINQLEGAEDRYEITRIGANYQKISATVIDTKYIVTRYAITTENNEPSSWITIDPASDQKHIYTLSETVAGPGTYYVWFKDYNDRVISDSITVTADLTGPDCTWGTFSPVTIANTQTSQITLTCTDSQSGVSVTNIATSDIETSNNSVTVTNVSRTATNNGYIYTITVTGTANDGTTTLTLPEDTVMNTVGIGNSESTSNSITVQNANDFIITLDNANATTNGTSTIYMRYDAGVYLDSGHTNQMTTSANNITIPQRTGYTFAGYYDGNTQMISATGYITNNFTNIVYSSTTTLTAAWTARTYTINYLQGNAGSTGSNSSLGTKTCTFATACALDTYASLGATIPYSDRGWTFYGWSAAQTSTTLAYTDGGNVNPATYPTNGELNIYVIAERPVYFFRPTTANIAVNDTETRTQYWIPYTYGSTYVTAVENIPAGRSISNGWNFIGYRSSNEASSTVLISANQAGGSYKVPAEQYAYYRSIYSRELTLAYNDAGGSGTVPTSQTDTQYYNNGSGTAATGANVTTVTFELASTTLTKSGYSFNGWATSSEATSGTAAGGTTTFNPAVTSSTTTKTMYAAWNPNSYVVTINADDGSIPTTSGWTLNNDSITAYKSVTYNSTYGTLPTSPTKTGYTFDGWKNIYTFGDKTITSESGTTNTNFRIYKYAKPGVTYTIEMTSATLTAGSATSFTTHCYDRDSAQVLSTVTTALGSNLSYSITCPASADRTHDIVLIVYAGVAGSTGGNTIAFTGIKINSTATSSSTTYTSSSTVVTPRNHDLVAQWTAKTITISYSGNGCSGVSGVPSNQTYTYASSGTTTLSSSSPTCAGYKFIGWAQSSSATSADYQPSGSWSLSNLPNSGTTFTLYAVWSTNKVTVTLQKDGSNWSSSGLYVALYQNGSEVYGSSSATVSGATYTFSEVPTGTYDIYASYNDSSHKDIMADTGTDATISSSTNTASKTVSYYTLTRSAGTHTTLTFTYSNNISWVASTSIAFLKGTTLTVNASADDGYTVGLTVCGTSRSDGYVMTVTSTCTIATTATARTYTLYYRQGKGESSGGNNTLSTKTCTFGTSCSLSTYSSLGGTIPLSDKGWTFYGWSATPTSTTRAYTDGGSVNPSTYPNLGTSDEGKMYIYVIAQRTVYFARGIAPTTTTNKTQYWIPYSTSSTYATCVDIPAMTTISYNWTAQCYRANDTASSSCGLNADYNGTCYKIPVNNVVNYRSIYNRTMTITFDKNGGTGTVPSDLTHTQYYNSGFPVNGTNEGANVTSYAFTLPTTTLTKTGYAFSGWNTSSTAKSGTAAGATYAYKPSVTNSSPTKIQYATWGYKITTSTCQMYTQAATQGTGASYASSTTCNNNCACTCTANGAGTTYLCPLYCCPTNYTLSGTTCYAYQTSSTTSTGTTCTSATNFTTCNSSNVNKQNITCE